MLLELEQEMSRLGFRKKPALLYHSSEDDYINKVSTIQLVTKVYICDNDMLVAVQKEENEDKEDEEYYISVHRREDDSTSKSILIGKNLGWSEAEKRMCDALEVQKVKSLHECKDCGLDTKKVHEEYMVEDLLWKKAGMKPKDGCLCIGCLERRIDRRLTHRDFTDIPVNFGCTKKSRRLKNRLRGLKKKKIIRRWERFHSTSWEKEKESFGCKN